MIYLRRRYSQVVLILVALWICGIGLALGQGETPKPLLEDWERFGFTDERQVEILQNFEFSTIEMHEPMTFMEMTTGDSCNVLGERIPRMWTTKFPVTVVFSRLCNSDLNEDSGLVIMSRLNARIGELSQLIFQNLADGRLQALSVDKTGNNLCAFTFMPILRH